jgi:hypothetical protein
MSEPTTKKNGWNFAAAKARVEKMMADAVDDAAETRKGFAAEIEKHGVASAIRWHGAAAMEAEWTGAFVAELLQHFRATTTKVEALTILEMARADLTTQIIREATGECSTNPLANEAARAAQAARRSLLDSWRGIGNYVAVIADSEEA